MATIKIPFLITLAYCIFVLFAFWSAKLPLAFFRWLAAPALGIAALLWVYQQEELAHWSLFAGQACLAGNFLLAHFVTFIKNDYQ